MIKKAAATLAPVNIYFDENETFDVTIPFKGHELVFTMRKVPSYKKWAIFKSSVIRDPESTLPFDVDTYYRKMLVEMVQDNNVTGGPFTEDQVNKLDPDIRSVLEAHVPSVEPSTAFYENSKKV